MLRGRISTDLDVLFFVSEELSHTKVMQSVTEKMVTAGGETETDKQKRVLG